jgi:pyruvate,water dikinase
VDTAARWVIPLRDATDEDERFVGGKAARLGALTRAGLRVPPGVCVTTAAYDRFVDRAGLRAKLHMELGRKPFETMRWEEIWDAALRLRGAFLAAPLPAEVAAAIRTALAGLGADEPLAVRSSAVGEDAPGRSFAGLHESIVGVRGVDAVLDAVRVVWASLWSDAALLYRHELALDPMRSRMAVVVQIVVGADRAGVAFGRDPRTPAADHAVVEAVPGPCSDLVDGAVDPDRWILARTTGRVLEWRPGAREETVGARLPLLARTELDGILAALHGVESLVGWAPDLEWAMRSDELTLLQARPITATTDASDPRAQYLALRPGLRRLRRLAVRVAEELIPALEADGHRLAAEDLGRLDDEGLAHALEARAATVIRWKEIYRDEFIPLAHGVRQLGRFYNDAVRPADPYEFVGLLQGERMIASRRNAAVAALATDLRRQPALLGILTRLAGGLASTPASGWSASRSEIEHVDGGREFVRDFENVLHDFLDVAYGCERLADHPGWLLGTVLELASMPTAADGARLEDRTGFAAATPAPSAGDLERRLLDAVGPERHDEARELLALGRLSWRLRDDDNLLVGRLESQLLRALAIAAARLCTTGRLRTDAGVTPAAVPVLAAALRSADAIADLPTPDRPAHPALPRSTGEGPRQLTGQPAGPGLASGLARTIRGPADLGLFRAGEVLVCDAIQPAMTHLVPLAAAVVERRGGMLIHGAIIARELGIPCVNGVADAIDGVANGELLIVDGYLGIVTVGTPDFDLERRGSFGHARG